MASGCQVAAGLLPAGPGAVGQNRGRNHQKTHNGKHQREKELPHDEPPEYRYQAEDAAQLDGTIPTPRGSYVK